MDTKKDRKDRFGSAQPEHFIIDLIDTATGEKRQYMKVDGRTIAFWREFPNGKKGFESEYNADTGEYKATVTLYENKEDLSENYLVKASASHQSLEQASVNATRAAYSSLGYGIFLGASSNPDANDIPANMLSATLLPDTGLDKAAKPKHVEKETIKDSPKDSQAPTEEKKPAKKRGRKKKENTANVSTQETPVDETQIAIDTVTTPAKNKTVVAEEVQTEVQTSAEKFPFEESPTVTQPTSESLPFEEPVTKVAKKAKIASKNPPTSPQATTEDINAKFANIDIANMSLAEAQGVKVPFGQKKGQFMGEVFATDPRAVRWYAETYAGDNALVKKAAQIILEHDKQHQ